MHKMILLAGIGAAALLAAPAANAGAASAPPTQIQNDNAVATDVSARRRYHRRYVRYHRPYYGPSYAYYPPPAYYSPGPAISFSFGGGGYRHGGWGRHW